LDNIITFFEERLLPADEFQALELAKEVIASPPEIGYFTITNALQWRLQYKRVIGKAEDVDGIHRIR